MVKPKSLSQILKSNRVAISATKNLTPEINPEFPSNWESGLLHPEDDANLEPVKEMIDNEFVDGRGSGEAMKVQPYKNRLSYLFAAGFASNLEDAMASLHFLEKCNNRLLVIGTMLNIDSLLRKKYGVEPSSSHEEDSICYPLDCDDNKVLKMTADRTSCMDILKRTYTDLCIKKSFKPLMDRVYVNKVGKITLKEEVAEKKMRYRELYRHLRAQRNFHKLAQNECASRVNNSMRRNVDYEQTSTTECRYVNHWQNSQIEQYKWKIDDEHDLLKENIKKYKYNVDRESVASLQLDMYHRVSMDEKFKQIEVISSKYDTDIELIDLKIQIMASDYTSKLYERKALEDKIAHRQKEMIDWTRYKQDRESELARVKRTHESAATVQAWWRGILVRHRLGPFTPKRKKGKGGRGRKINK